MLAYPADRELNPADIRICRISGYPADIRRSWWSWGASTGASVGHLESVGSVERVWSIFGWIQNKLRSKMLPATAKKLVMVHMWLKMETMKESGKWEADLLEHTDEDLTWEQLSD